MESAPYQTQTGDREVDRLMVLLSEEKMGRRGSSGRDSEKGENEIGGGDRADRDLKARRKSRESKRHGANRISDSEEDYILLPAAPDDAHADMSVNSNNMFPSFLDNTPNTRLPQSPMQPQQANGNGAINGMGVAMPMNAGQQMDVNMLYQRVLELSEILRDNREKTQGIVAGAEELAVSHP